VELESYLDYEVTMENSTTEVGELIWAMGNASEVYQSTHPC